MSDETLGAELVARMARGDVQAFERFYDRYASLAFGLIRRVLGEREAAEDVLQEVFWQVWKEAAGYDPARGSVEAWLVMRAKTRAIDKLRARKRAAQVGATPLSDTAAVDAAPASDDVAAAVESRGVVEGLLVRLPEAQRRVIELAFFAGLTQVEIAARLGEPLGTVKTRCRLALERLRAMLAPEERQRA